MTVSISVKCHLPCLTAQRLTPVTCSRLVYADNICVLVASLESSLWLMPWPLCMWDNFCPDISQVIVFPLSLTSITADLMAQIVHQVQASLEDGTGEREQPEGEGGHDYISSGGNGPQLGQETKKNKTRTLSTGANSPCRCTG